MPQASPGRTWQRRFRHRMVLPLAAPPAPFLIGATNSTDGASNTSLTVTDPGAPVGSVGFLVVSWTVSATDETVAVTAAAGVGNDFTRIDPNVGTQNVGTALFARVKGAGDSSTITVTMPGGRHFTVAAAWYQGSGWGTVGTLADRNGVSSALITAPGITVGAAGEQVIGLYTERTTAAGTTVGVDVGLTRVFREDNSAANGSTSLVADFTATGTSSGSQTATYNSASGNGAGLLVELLPVTAGGTVNGDASLTVTATISPDSSVTANATASPAITATISPTAAVDANATASLAVTATISATATVTRSTTASLSVTATISPTATLTAAAQATLGVTATISATANVGAVATLTTTAAISPTTAVTANATASPASTAGITATATVTRPAQTAPTTTATITVAGATQANASATCATTAMITLVVDVTGPFTLGALTASSAPAAVLTGTSTPASVLTASSARGGPS